jgi:DNA-binding transcriptional MerR regulator
LPDGTTLIQPIGLAHAGAAAPRIRDGSAGPKGAGVNPMHPKTPEPVEIPDKLYFRIGEVSKLVAVPAHVLRFWETEFNKVRPKRTPTGQRLYTQKDIRLILKIKHLLYDRRFTIQGARQHLGRAPGRKAGVDLEALAEIRSELLRIRDLLDR